MNGTNAEIPEILLASPGESLPCLLVPSATKRPDPVKGAVVECQSLRSGESSGSLIAVSKQIGSSSSADVLIPLKMAAVSAE